jgi:hypothetical protein
MGIELKEYEKCFTAHFMPTLFYGLKGEDLRLIDNKKITDPDIAESLSRGMMVCEGKLRVHEEKDEDKGTVTAVDKNTIIELEPQKVIENYYYITQHFTAGDMLDEGNLLNHVWLLPLRGTKDFNNFMRVANAKVIKKKGGEDIKKDDRYLYPNVRLRSNYNQILPSFPGMYTVQSI